ncbi:hypothetical protein Tco_0253549, partial [Tanacetum coccineum]
QSICHPIEVRAGCCLETDASDSLGFFELWLSSFGGGLADPEAAESDLLLFVDLPWFDQPVRDQDHHLLLEEWILVELHHLRQQVGK